jgi:hypothetical protein
MWGCRTVGSVTLGGEPSWQTFPLRRPETDSRGPKHRASLTDSSSDNRLLVDRSGELSEAMGGHEIEAECLDADPVRRADAVPSTVGLAVARSDPKQSRIGVNE